MFQVNSYLLKPGCKVTDLDDLVQNPQNYFVEITDSKSLGAIRHKLNFKYLDGAICLQYYDQVLMDFRYWDSIDMLWASILDLVDDVLQKGEGREYFPDQPVKLGLKPAHKNWLIFSIEDSRTSRFLLPRNEFLLALVQGAEQFFNVMIHGFGLAGKYACELEKLKRLKDELQ